MPLIPQEDISRVLEANDLVSIASEVVPGLKQNGGKFVACCPFHKEKTPSFQIDPNLQLWHCFGCGEGGNLVKFVEKKYDMGFREAIMWLADRANIKLNLSGGGKGQTQNYKQIKSKNARIMQAYKIAADFYHRQLMQTRSAGANTARQYMGGRKLGSEICQRWNVGFAPGSGQLTRVLCDAGYKPPELIEANLCVKGKNGQLQDRFYNRVMFPINDALGRPIAFGGRIMGDGQPKYLNSSEHPLFKKSKVLYGLDKAKSTMASTGTAIVVEGYTDVIAMHEAGISNAVATLGTSLTRQHIRVLNQHAKKRIIYLFDGDEAGQRAAERALQFIGDTESNDIYGKQANLEALTLPDDLDPAEFLEQYGADKLNELLNNTKPLIQYGIERKLSTYDLSNPAEKSRAAKVALRVLVPIKGTLTAEPYITMISDRCGIAEDALRRELENIKAPRVYDQAQYDTGGTYDQSSQMQVDMNAATAQGVDAQKVQAQTDAERLESELLCCFAKNPSALAPYIKSCDIEWSNDVNKKLFASIRSAVDKNSEINARDLITFVYSQNEAAANELTRISVMYDLQQKPSVQAEYLIKSLQIEALENKISQAKNSLRDSGTDEFSSDIFELQKQLATLKNELRSL